MRSPSTLNVEELSIGRWEDELGRLRMWAANIGAHRTGQSSLDYRLRDASHIRQQVLKLLDIVRRRLKDTRELLDEGSEGDNSSDDEDSNPDGASEVAQMQDSVATMINYLFQMSMLVRNPAKHDVRGESFRSGISAFAPYDINHVREKFPKANEVLISRLGTAITQRRKYLNYRERHAAKLKQGLSAKASGIDTATAGGLSDTIATDPQQNNINFDDHASDSGVSQTSYALTLKSGGNITIPPAPKASHNGEPFECPFCYHIIMLDQGHSWAKHVFQDLQPYVCLEGDCTTPNKMYTNRWEWIYHMRNVHTKSEKQEEPDGGTANPCPLCDLMCVNLGHLNKHVARHMQELALFVLPQEDEDPDEDSNRPEMHTPSVNSLSANASFIEDGKHFRCPFPRCTHKGKGESNYQQHIEKAHGRKEVPFHSWKNIAFKQQRRSENAVEGQNNSAHDLEETPDDMPNLASSSDRGDSVLANDDHSNYKNPLVDAQDADDLGFFGDSQLRPYTTMVNNIDVNVYGHSIKNPRLKQDTTSEMLGARRARESPVIVPSSPQNAERPLPGLGAERGDKTRPRRKATVGQPSL